MFLTSSFLVIDSKTSKTLVKGIKNFHAMAKQEKDSGFGQQSSKITVNFENFLGFFQPQKLTTQSRRGCRARAAETRQSACGRAAADVPTRHRTLPPRNRAPHPAAGTNLLSTEKRKRNFLAGKASKKKF